MQKRQREREERRRQRGARADRQAGSLRNNIQLEGRRHGERRLSGLRTDTGLEVKARTKQNPTAHELKLGRDASISSEGAESTGKDGALDSLGSSLRWSPTTAQLRSV